MSSEAPEHRVARGPTVLEHLLTTPEAAAILKAAPITLCKWRVYGGGPLFIRTGRNIRYRVADLEQWATARTVATTSQAA
jgi:hypothetical protein